MTRVYREVLSVLEEVFFYRQLLMSGVFRAFFSDTYTRALLMLVLVRRRSILMRA